MTDEDLAVDQQEEGAELSELSDEEQEMSRLKEAISVGKEEVGSLRFKLAVTVPRSHLDERLSEQFDELRREADIPGFRRGHAPMRLVEKRFAHEVGDQLKGQLISKAFLAACEKEEIEALGDPLFWIHRSRETGGGKDGVEQEVLVGFDTAIDHLSLPKEGDLSFSCEVEVKPEFELPELSGIPLTRTPVEVNDEDVERQVERFLMFRGTYETIDGKIVEDDVLVGRVTGVVDGDEIFAVENEMLPARDTQVKGIPVKGFLKSVKGKKAGDSVSFDGVVPDDYDEKDYRGKSVSMEMTIDEVKRLKLPELTKEFAEQLGYETPDEVRDSIRGALEGRAEEASRGQMFEQLGDFLLEKADFEVPEGLSRRQTERSLLRRRVKLLQDGIPEMEVDKQIDEIRDTAHDQVLRDLKLHFILDKIASAEEIDVREEHLNAAIANIAQQSNKRFDRVRDELIKNDQLQFLYLELRDKQVLATLLERAEVTESTAEKKPEKKAAKKAPKKKAAKKAVKKKAAKKKSKSSDD